ncbi:MAG: hypothetical protein ACNI25_02725 [Halarcobacter sp.]
MNTINTNSNSSLLYLQQEKSSVNKNVETTQETNQNTKEIKENKKVYDFENITPHETYELAHELYESGQIDVFQVSTLMIIGFQQEYNTSNKPIDVNNKDNEAFNLFAELDKKISNTNENFSYKDLKDAAINLIELLKSIGENSSNINKNSIDISI